MEKHAHGQKGNGKGSMIQNGFLGKEAGFTPSKRFRRKSAEKGQMRKGEGVF